MVKRETWRRGKGIVSVNAEVGLETKVWHYCNLYNCKIGEHCVIGSFTEIGNGVKIGNYCKIQSGVFIPEGVIVEDEVFIGPNVVFTNDLKPKAIPCLEYYAGEKGWICTLTVIKRGASIGANSTIRCGVTIGENALIGCGSTVIKNVPAGETWVGNPAKRIRYGFLKRIKIWYHKRFGGCPIWCPFKFWRKIKSVILKYLANHSEQ